MPRWLALTAALLVALPASAADKRPLTLDDMFRFKRVADPQISPSGKEVVYVVYKDEGHGFARPENRLHFFAITEQFLAKHLGGRAEPITEIAGHSGEMR